MVRSKLALSLLATAALAAGVFAETLSIDTEKSRVNWEGRKVTGAHSGTIQIKSGTVKFDKDQIVGGSIIIDMTSIKVTDITDPGMNARLERHLKNEDFFAVNRFNTARFDIHGAELIQSKGKRQQYRLMGELEVKGIKQDLAMTIWVSRGRIAAAAEGQATVDRTLYDIRYKSSKFFPEMGDRAIYDDFEISFDLMTQQESNSQGSS